MAIGNDGRLNLSACYTRNDREFLGGFSDWAKNLAESRSARDDERKAFVREVVQPLQEKLETVSVVPGWDDEARVAQRFPHKTVKRVRSSLTPISVEGFCNGLSMTFQPGQARNLTATYHFASSGAEPCRATCCWPCSPAASACGETHGCCCGLRVALRSEAGVPRSSGLIPPDQQICGLRIRQPHPVSGGHRDR
jgi:hypothetical protein